MPVARSADPSTSPASAAITALRAAAHRGDADAVAELLAPDVVFHSPFTTRIRFEGKEEVAALHRDIFAVLEDLVTTEPLALGDTRSFTFHARVRGVELEASALVRFNEHAQIADFKVFVPSAPGPCDAVRDPSTAGFGAASRTPVGRARGHAYMASRLRTTYRRSLGTQTHLAHRP